MNYVSRQNADSERARIYRELCLLLSLQADRVDWASYSTADWDLLTRIALGEGVAPLLYSILAESSSQTSRTATNRSASIPQGVIDHLAESYYQSAAYNAVLCRELDGILAGLSGAGVEVILLKGAALIKTLYADPALRPMNDLDLLVRRADLPRAVRVLQSCGYRCLMDNYVHFHVFMLGGQSGETSVELHWSLVVNDQRFPGLIGWFWGQSQPLDAYSHDVYAFSTTPRTLNPTAHLLYLAAHLGLQHQGQERLCWLYDLFLLVTRLHDRIDWDKLIEQAIQAGWAAVLHATLTAVQQRFGQPAGTLPLPVGWLDRLGEQAALENEQAALERKQAQRKQHKIPKSAVEGMNTFRVTWIQLDARDRLGLLRGIFFPRPAYLRWRYHPKPEWLWPLWYVKRWIDLLADGV